MSQPVLNERPISEPDPIEVPDRSVLVLGIDLGTTSGYCYRFHDRRTGAPVGPLYLGLWNLSAGDFDSGALRFARLRNFLRLIGPGLIAYEDAKVQIGDMNNLNGPKPQVVGIILRNLRMAELFGAFKATLAAWAEEYGVPSQGFNVSTIKKRATGKGNANKEMIVAAMIKDLGLTVDPEVEGLDNVADAFYIYTLAVEQLLGGVITTRGD